MGPSGVINGILSDLIRSRTDRMTTAGSVRRTGHVVGVRVRGMRVWPSTVSNLNKKIYGTIENMAHPADRRGASLHVHRGIVLKRSWAGEARNISLLVAIGVNGEGYAF